MNKEINTLQFKSNCAAVDSIALDMKKLIRDLSSYHGKRWKRGYWNQPGVYDVKLNFQQVMIIHKALKKLDKEENKTHLQQEWNTMVKEIQQDYNERMVEHEQKNNRSS